MPNGGDLTHEQFEEWKRAFAPYELAIREFAGGKGLFVEKWYHEYSAWHIGKVQGIDDLNTIWRVIQFNYNESTKEFSLNAVAWLDREYHTSGGLVRERRLVLPEKSLVATWKAGKRVNIKKLLEKAYQIFTSFVEQDLTWVSASIQGKDGVWRNYDPTQRAAQ